jgi:hypothetical protein
MKNKNTIIEKLKAAMESVDLMAPITEGVEPMDDYEEEETNADMAMSDLRTIIRNAQELHDMMTEDMTLPAWLAGKITLSADYIGAAAEYMKSEQTEPKEMDDLGENEMTEIEVND